MWLNFICRNPSQNVASKTHTYLCISNKKKYKNTYRLDPLDQIDGILSGIKYNKTSGKVIRASAFLNIWLLKQNGTKDPNGELIDAVAMEWEKVFIEEIIVKEKNMGNQEDLTINGFTDRRYAKYLKIQIKEGKYLTLLGLFPVLYTVSL